MGANKNDSGTEEEKKVIAALLGKLYVSPTSSEDKLQDVYELASEAVNGRGLADATSRNALLKLHAAVGKIVNARGGCAEHDDVTVMGARRSVSSSTTASVAGGGAAAGRAGTRSVSAATAASAATDATVMERDEDGEGADRTVVPRGDETTVMIGRDVDDEDDSVEGTVIHNANVQDEDSLVDDLLSDEE